MLTPTASVAETIAVIHATRIASDSSLAASTAMRTAGYAGRGSRRRMRAMSSSGRKGFTT